MFSLWQGRSAGMGWESPPPPKKSQRLVKKYKDVKNIKNSPAQKGGLHVNQIHTLIDKNKTIKPTTLYLPTSAHIIY